MKVLETKMKSVVIAGLCMAMLAGCDREEPSSGSRRRTTSVTKRVSRSLPPAAKVDRTTTRSAVVPTPPRQREETASSDDCEELKDSATYRWAVAYIKRIDETLDHDRSGKNEEN